MTRIYLDVCCLNRPFDDQTQDRVRIESESILTILGRCVAGNLQMVASEIVDVEISMIPDGERKRRVRMLSGVATHKVFVNKRVESRALELERMGFKPFDASHLACAEESLVDALLTTDDKFLRFAARKKSELRVIVRNPVDWLLEVIK